MTYYIEFYKGEKYESLDRAREKAIVFMEKEYTRDPNAHFVSHGIDIQKGDTTIGSVQVHIFRGKRKYLWQTDRGWYRLNKNGEKVIKAKDWHPFGL